jgi:hypothetical protein
MSTANELDEPRLIAEEALRLAQLVPDPALAAVLCEVAAIFGAGDGGWAINAA